MHRSGRSGTSSTGMRILLCSAVALALVVVYLAFAAGSRLPEVSAAPHTTETPDPTSSAMLLWDNGNIYAVDNHGASPTIHVKTDVYITEIWTYHWNYGYGAQPGTIALRDAFGYTFGPWQCSGTPGQGGVSNANWVCRPEAVLPAGTYVLVDSDPETWSQNAESEGFGMTRGYGWPYTGPTESPTVSPSPTQTPTASPTVSPTQSPTQTPTATPTPTVTPTPVDPATGWQSQPSGTSQTLRGVAAIDELRSYAVGDGGTIVATTNGGQTWSPQSSGTTAVLHDVFFLGNGGASLGKGITASRGWAVGNGGTILSTMNGGVTWTKQSSGTTADLMAVTFTDSQRGYAVGNGGTILSTMNGGGTWATRPSQGGMTLTDVTFTDAMRGYAVGSGGTILMTQNAGATWSQQASGSGSQLNSVSFVDQSRGWAAGAGGTILSTTNGGGTWLPQAMGAAGVDLSALTFLDAMRGFAVGAGGNLLSTQNGGISWSIQQLMAGTQLLGLVFPDLMRGWLVGQGGAILFTDTGGLPPKPILASVKPGSGKRKSVVTVAGANFGAARGAGAVLFGSKKCTTYLIWTPTKIICKVPAKAKKGKVAVTVVTSMGKSNAKTFRVK